MSSRAVNGTNGVRQVNEANGVNGIKSGPLYLGFDLSTQQLKGVAITSKLEVAHVVKVDFDRDLPHYGVTHGVHKHDDAQEVFAPVAMWTEAVDLVLDRLRDDGIDFARIKAISGAGQQHGSVYWSEDAEPILKTLDPTQTLVQQLNPRAFSHANSPNWQDGSTQKQCDQFDQHLGSPEELTRLTGSRAHHRFTGPQILRFHVKYPEDYRATARISLVSSYLASLFLGRVAPIDIGDVCGMNLWDMHAKKWSPELVRLAAGNSDEAVRDLTRKLGDVALDGGEILGTVNPWLVKRYDFDPECKVLPFTGDNPSTILAAPLRPQDAIVSLGTSTTFLASTPTFLPDPAYHFMHHPTTPGLYMFMLCYKNGGLARERVRDQINDQTKGGRASKSWTEFDRRIDQTPPMLKRQASDPAKMGLYFPLAEIVPNVRPGLWRFSYDTSLPRSDSKKLVQTAAGWNLPDDDARAIVESQLFSLRLRSQNVIKPPDSMHPPQPRRIYLVGGGARNEMIARTVGAMLGGSEGVFRLHAEENGCAYGSAQKAVWAIERTPNQTFDELIASRWKEEDSIRRVDQGYRPGVWEEYGEALPGFEAMEDTILKLQGAEHAR